MAIKKVLENGKNKYEVIVKVRDKSGKQVMRRKRWFASEREARKVEIDILMELEGFKTKVTWKKWVEYVLEKYRVEYRNSTYQNYKHMISKWFTPKWGELFLDEIKPADVHEIVFDPKAQISSYTRKTLLKIVKRFLNVALEEAVIVRNPAIGIKVRIVEANQEVLNKNEVQILLKQARRADHRFFNHWTLALLSGMRSGELYSLRWTDVDFASDKININKAWTKKNGEGATKSGKYRICPISNECRKFLEELKIKHAKDCEYVLPRLWEWDSGEQAKILKNFCKEIGITQIKFHDLRATFITQMLNNGVPLSKVMAIVGHASLKTTQGYLRLSGKDIEGATEELNIQVPENEERLANVHEFKRN